MLKPREMFRKNNRLCRVCENEKTKLRMKTNYEAYRNKRKSWQITNRTKEIERNRKWRDKNKERAIEYSRKRYLLNRENALLCSRNWRNNNADKVRAATNAYRARKRKSIGYGYTKLKHIVWRWELWGNRCWVCGKPAEATDHVIPLNPSYRDKPGPHLPANFRPICKSCNSSKINKRPDFSKSVSL
jgi:hypothetical protein